MFLFFLIFPFSASTETKEKSPTLSQMEQDFANPPVECRPRVRYWWFGGAVTREELARQLRSMKEQGLGGVEIQSIYAAKPEVPGHSIAPFASPEWVERVVACIEEAAKLGLKVDLTPSSGWPFGGPFVDDPLKPKNLRRMTVRLKGPLQKAIPIPGLNKFPRGQLMAVTLWQAKPPKKGGSVRAWDQPAQVLTERVSSEGTVTLNLPKGKWLLHTFWAEPWTHPVKRAGPGGEGSVLDHYSAEAIRRQLEWSVAPVLERAAPYVGATFDSLFTDSWELKRPSWTEKFLEEFRRRRGYDLTPYLHLAIPKRAKHSKIAGRIAYDTAQTRSELVVEQFYGELSRWARAHGLKARAQVKRSPCDWVDGFGALDIPEAELIGRKMRGATPAFDASVVYGKPVVSCETFTSKADHFRYTLADLRPLADRAFSAGINQIVLHGYSYSPPEAGFPGWDYYAGLEFGQNNTFWSYFRPFADYLARNCVLLRFGEPVSDIAVVGEEWHAEGVLTVRVTDRALLQEEATVENGVLHLGYGKFRLLVLNDAKSVPLELMEKIEAWVKQGLAVASTERPRQVPGFQEHQARSAQVREITARMFHRRRGLTPRQLESGKTWYLEKKDLPEVLKQLKVESQLTPPTLTGLRWIHRRGTNFDIFLLHNNTGWVMAGPFSFRAAGAVELWNAHSGRREPVPFESNGDRTCARLTLPPFSSRLVVIRRDRPAVSILAAPAQVPQKIRSLSGPWRLALRSIDGTTPVEKTWETLRDWRSEKELQTFSGSATYSFQFEFENSPPEGEEIRLDLGRVCDIARVRLNGTDLGICYEPPFQVDVTQTVKPGSNKLEIDVANRAENHFVPLLQQWMKKEGSGPGYFFQFPPDGGRLHRSGLLGPVRLITLRPAEEDKKRPSALIYVVDAK